MDDEDYQVNPDYGDFTDKEIEYPEEMEYPKDLELIAERHTPVTIEVDTTLQFQTDIEFENRDIVVEFAMKCGRKHGVVVVVKRSDINC